MIIADSKQWACIDALYTWEYSDDSPVMWEDMNEEVFHVSSLPIASFKFPTASGPEDVYIVADIWAIVKAGEEWSEAGNDATDDECEAYAFFLDEFGDLPIPTR